MGRLADRRCYPVSVARGVVVIGRARIVESQYASQSPHSAPATEQSPMRRGLAQPAAQRAEG